MQTRLVAIFVLAAGLLVVSPSLRSIGTSISAAKPDPLLALTRRSNLGHFRTLRRVGSEIVEAKSML